MAAPIESHGKNAISKDRTLSAYSVDSNNTRSAMPSKQLLYSEKFPETASDKLKILHSKKTDEHKTYKLPPSSVLNQVKGFLPQLKSSNADLERRIEIGETNDLDIENTDSCAGPVIEMNLALVEMKEDASEGSTSASEESNSDSESDNNMDDAVAMRTVTEKNIKLTQTKDRKSKMALIEVMQGKEGPGLRETTDSVQNDSVQNDSEASQEKIVNGVIT